MALRAVFLFFLLLQVGFYSYSKHYLPKLGIVPPVPSTQELAIYALGDKQLLFRAFALRLQQSGDTFGRVTALYKYDYPALERWFLRMDSLDNESHFIPTLASYYFAQSQHKPDTRYIIDYLDFHTKGRAQTRWWWVIQAAYLAKHKLKDDARALQLAKRLEGVEGIPLWAQQYPAFLYEQEGEFEAAARIIENIAASSQNISEKELSFMQYFLKERLNKLEEKF
jgi:hypothetical protein